MRSLKKRDLKFGTYVAPKPVSLYFSVLMMPSQMCKLASAMCSNVSASHHRCRLLNSVLIESQMIHLLFRTENKEIIKTFNPSSMISGSKKTQLCLNFVFFCLFVFLSVVEFYSNCVHSQRFAEVFPSPCRGFH